MVICLERGADLHMAQLMPVPLTISCSSKIQIGFTFLVPAHLGSPGKRAIKQVCVCEGNFYRLSYDRMLMVYVVVCLSVINRSCTKMAELMIMDIITDL